MELLSSGKLKNKINLYMTRAIGYKNCELEFIYGSNPGKGKIERDEFIRILDTLNNKYETLSEENSLDIRIEHNSYLSSLRFTIHGIEDIKKYCRENSFENIANVTYMKKNFYKDEDLPSVKFDTIVDYDYNFRVNLKSEEELEETHHQVQKSLIGWKDKLKYFRYKKRKSFITSDKLFRIDITAIKANEYDKKLKKNKLFKTFLESGILKNKEQYEIEIEYIGSIHNGKTFPIDVFTEKIYLENDEKIEKMKEMFKKQGDELEKSYTTSDFVSFTPEDVDEIGDINIDQEWVTEPDYYTTEEGLPISEVYGAIGGEFGPEEELLEKVEEKK